MTTVTLINDRVRTCYHDEDINCATTSLRILAELCGIVLNQQVVDAAIGMHGAGGYGAQCGLVEGGLMFIGIMGRKHRLPDEVIVDICREFGRRFEEHFSSLQCSSLRPEGFHPENPPHLCENLTCRATEFTARFVEEQFERSRCCR
ncbi:C-GCAxxG-C-C family protein [Desulfopila sp. IMCC35008]|uniref:C-GCAxxG-C-C family protein n=1 Tax=Desulfopila sp. IMCC35008 TaxID=2653858 RepID=UPI0013D0E2B5|nr:C-GCAxxG-C-C family protein [Desulfopila sp. IMCC35008]